MLEPKLPPMATLTTLILPMGMPNTSCSRRRVLCIVWVVLHTVMPPPASGLTTTDLGSNWSW